MLRSFLANLTDGLRPGLYPVAYVRRGVTKWAVPDRLAVQLAGEGRFAYYLPSWSLTVTEAYLNDATEPLILPYYAAGAGKGPLDGVVVTLLPSSDALKLAGPPGDGSAAA